MSVMFLCLSESALRFALVYPFALNTWYTWKLFKDNIYKNNHLSKPDVLEMVDYLNAKLNYKLDYNVFDEKQLIDKVVKLHE